MIILANKMMKPVMRWELNDKKKSSNDYYGTIFAKAKGTTHIKV